MVKTRLQLWLLFVLVTFCLGKLDLRNVISYKEMNYSYYQPWNLHGELTFLFKTSKRNGLLVYQDDGKHSYVEVFLVEGSVRFKACLGSCDADSETFIYENFADGFWHRLRIAMKSKNCTISVDDRLSWVPCAGLVDQRFKYYQNFLHVANFNPTVSLNKLVLPGAFHEALYSRFQGCVGDVRFTNYQGKLVEATLKQTTGDQGCDSACAAPNVKTCQNKGKCMDEIGHVVCECMATGYEGPSCAEPTSSVFLNGSGYLMYNVGFHHPGRSTVANTIAFRFATTKPRGVLLVTDIADDHVLIELENGFLRVSWDLGQGGLVLMSRHGCLQDGVWHAVIVTRLQRRIKMTVDNQRPLHAAIPGKFSFLDFKGGNERMYFGGGPPTTAFNRSLSRVNFTGFVQQMQFDEFDVIDEVIANKTFQLSGDGVLNPNSLYHLIPTSPSPKINCSREVDPDREALCEKFDDEDMCGPLSMTSGEGPLVPDCDGSCSESTETRDTTGNPLVQTSHNIEPSANKIPLTSLMEMTSQIRPTPPRLQTPTPRKVIALSRDSVGLENQNNSGSQANNATSADPKFTQNKSELLTSLDNGKSRVLPSPFQALAGSSGATYKDTNSLVFSVFKPTAAAIQVNGTLSAVVISTSSVDNSYSNDVTKSAGRPPWLLVLVFATIVSWY